MPIAEVEETKLERVLHCYLMEPPFCIRVFVQARGGERLLIKVDAIAPDLVIVMVPGGTPHAGPSP